MTPIIISFRIRTQIPFRTDVCYQGYISCKIFSVVHSKTGVECTKRIANAVTSHELLSTLHFLIICDIYIVFF